MNKTLTPSNVSHEACLSCGEETAAGSVLYSDRRAIHRDNGTRSYLCSFCAERLAASRHQKRLSDDEIRRLTNNWSAAVNAFTGGH